MPLSAWAKEVKYLAVRSAIPLMQQNQGGFWGTMWMSAALLEENNSSMSRVLRVHAFELLVVILSLYQCDSRSSVSSFPSIMACDHPEPFAHFPLAEMATRLQLRSACWCLRTVSGHCLQIWGSLLPRDRSRHDSHSSPYVRRQCWTVWFAPSWWYKRHPTSMLFCIRVLDVTNGVYTVSPSVQSAACAVCKVVQASAFGCSRERIATGSVDLPTVGFDSKLTVPSHLPGLLSQSLLSLARGSSVLETASVVWLPMRILLPVFLFKGGSFLFFHTFCFRISNPLATNDPLFLFVLQLSWVGCCLKTARSLNELWLKGNPIDRLKLQVPLLRRGQCAVFLMDQFAGSVRATMTRFDPPVFMSTLCPIGASN